MKDEQNKTEQEANKQAKASEKLTPKQYKAIAIRVLKGVVLLAPLILIVQMLCDVEYQGHDITAHGIGIFSWMQAPERAKNQLDRDESQNQNQSQIQSQSQSQIQSQSQSQGQNQRQIQSQSQNQSQSEHDTPSSSQVQDKPSTELFIDSSERLNPNFIKQGAVFDCRFLATVASMSATERGRKILLNSVSRQPNGNYLVNLVGVQKKVEVAPLSERERKLYASATSFDGRQGGCWLPILEKAYGTWRSETQDPWHIFLRTIKHFILDGRLTALPELPGFGASYGATDDSAARAFTGDDLQSFSTFSFDCGDFGLGKGYVTARQIESWFGREAVRQKYIDEQDKLLTNMQKDSLVCLATTELSTKARAYGLRSSHAYAVIGYQPKNKVITLKDPYGNGDFKSTENGQCFDKVDDGVFQLSLYDFNELFSHLRVESSF